MDWQRLGVPPKALRHSPAAKFWDGAAVSPITGSSSTSPTQVSSVAGPAIRILATWETF